MSPSLSSSEPLFTAAGNPSEWRFTWEGLSHTTTLRLLLFSSNTKPSTQCRDLRGDLFLEQFVLIVSFFDVGEVRAETSVKVPVPRVLVDPEAPVHLRAFEDHIEVKLVLLLPLSHPLVSDVDSILDFGGNKDELRSVVVDSDLKKLSSMEEVHFNCRSCSNKLTKGFRCFIEMPSVNWRDAADNWFGSCCCSFGGVSEKLVTKYAKSYTCAVGVCLLSTTAVLLCKDDILGCEFPDIKIRNSCELELKSSSYNAWNRVLPDEACAPKSASCGNIHDVNFHANNGLNFHRAEENVLTSSRIVDDDSLSTSRPSKTVIREGSLSGSFPTLHISETEAQINGSLTDAKRNVRNCDAVCCPSSSESYAELLENQKVFLDGFLGNGFIVGSSALSKDIKWTEYFCPQCLCLVGAYPSVEDNVPLDGGVRLFKCCISTCKPSSGINDVFRNYTLERIFSTQLLESAEDELSFRTLIRDIQTKSPMLQIILLNPNSWCCTGHCLNSDEPVVQPCMQPIIKVLFSSCTHAADSDSSIVEDWARKNEADEVYMFSSQVKELIRGLEHSNFLYPPSLQFLQGLFLSSMKR